MNKTRSIELKTVRVELVCDVCDLSMVAQESVQGIRVVEFGHEYEHACDNGHLQYDKNIAYPYIEYVEVELDE